jgi:hypothetical protein
MLVPVNAKNTFDGSRYDYFQYSECLGSADVINRTLAHSRSYLYFLRYYYPGANSLIINILPGESSSISNLC